MWIIEIALVWMVVAMVAGMFVGSFIKAGRGDGYDKPQRDDL